MVGRGKDGEGFDRLLQGSIYTSVREHIGKRLMS